MSLRILCILFSLIVFVPSLNGLSIDYNRLGIKSSINDGVLYENNGERVLFVSGSYYEMGYQQGFLLKNQTQTNFNAFLHWINKQGYNYEELASQWHVMKPYLPQCYIDEMQGIADGSDLSFENISVLNVGFYLVVNCGSFAAWGSATKDGKLYHARSHDFPINLEDPETGIYLVDTQVLIVRKPNGFFSSVSPSEAGFVSVSDGINENGIVVGMLSSWTDDEKLRGIGVGFRIRMVLDFANTAEEAIKIITENTTLGYNFIVTDWKIPMGYAVETTSNLTYVGTWDNKIESTYPFWSIDCVVRRTNMFVNLDLAKTQRKNYNPSIFPLLSSLICTNKLSGTSVSSSSPWLHYKAISKGIERQWGNLDLNTTMDVVRDIYLGKTSFRFSILQFFGAYTTPYQWVICPETGDFVISYATRDKNAFENNIYFYNMYKLLEHY